MAKNNEILEMLDTRVEEMDKSELILFTPIVKKRWRLSKKVYLKIGNHDPVKAKEVARNITFPPFIGSRGLVPLRGVGQRSTNPW